jgi:hypothetical protein
MLPTARERKLRTSSGGGKQPICLLTGMTSNNARPGLTHSCWKRQLEDGRCCSISEIAKAENIDRGYVGSILRLTLLAPDIVEALLDGRQSAGLGLPALLKPFPLEWDRHRQAFAATA